MLNSVWICQCNDIASNHSGRIFFVEFDIIRAKISQQIAQLRVGFFKKTVDCSQSVFGFSRTSRRNSVFVFSNFFNKRIVTGKKIFHRFRFVFKNHLLNYITFFCQNIIRRSHLNIVKSGIAHIFFEFNPKFGSLGFFFFRSCRFSSGLVKKRIRKIQINKDIILCHFRNKTVAVKNLFFKFGAWLILIIARKKQEDFFIFFRSRSFSVNQIVNPSRRINIFRRLADLIFFFFWTSGKNNRTHQKNSKKFQNFFHLKFLNSKIWGFPACAGRAFRGYGIRLRWQSKPATKPLQPLSRRLRPCASAHTIITSFALAKVAACLPRENP